MSLDACEPARVALPLCVKARHIEPRNMKVPIVDLTRDDAASVVRRALHTTGFFYLAHDDERVVARDVIDDMFAHSKAFFRLPDDTKARLCGARGSGSNRGWTRVHEETLDAKNSTVGDSKEGMYIGRECTREELERGAPLVGRNAWPDETEEPSISGYRRAMERYYDAMVRIGMRLLPLVAAALDLDEDYFDQFWTPTHNSLLRPLRYAATKSDAAAGKFAAGAHSDYGGLTILKTDDVPGLEIFIDGQWVPVPPRPNAFIVNTGDLLEIWSNGRLRSTKHRVMTNGDVERFSAAFFFEPNYEAVVAPVVRNADEAPKYSAIKFGDYLLARYSETYADFSQT